MERNCDTCPICLDSLCGRALGVCTDANGQRKCLHYFHLDCLRKVEGAQCPQCRVRFFRRTPFPHIQEDPDSWFRLASTSSEDSLSRKEVSAALRAMLMLPPQEVDALIESSWHHWTQGESFSRNSLDRLVATVAEHMQHERSPDAASLSPHAERPSPPSPQMKKEDHDHKEDGHSRSGVVCKCGQIHVRRGDRVCRGPSPTTDDERGIRAGDLGTIARVGAGQETVIVKWDRTCPDKAHTYTWPDPDGLVVCPAFFGQVAEDVAELQKSSGLSSFAAEESLRRVHFDLSKARAEVAWVCEKDLRNPPKLYHHVRVLPDSLLVQQWFDAIPPCKCGQQTCHGGLTWSSRADKHLGREAIVLKIDEKDDTVLVETVGPCECKIWYPCLAVEPVYNPDLSFKPSLTVNSRVECRMEQGWLPGIVNEVLWNGLDRKGPIPYTVTLDDGRSVNVPNACLIRAI